MGRYWSRFGFGIPLHHIELPFNGPIPPIERFVTELNKRTGLQHHLVSQDMKSGYEVITLALEGTPEEEMIDLHVDYETNSVIVFYSSHLRYLPNSIIWTLVYFGGISEMKIPSWTALKWDKVRWWHLATDRRFILWHASALISCALIICFAPFGILIQGLTNLFKGK